MPILYIHGVATRDRARFFAIEEYLRRLVAPAISTTPESVLIDDVFWGEKVAPFAWNGLSRPLSRLLGQGAEDIAPIVRLLIAEAEADALKRVPKMQTAVPESGGLVSGSTSSRSPLPQLRLKNLSPDEISNLLAAMLESKIADPKRRAQLVLFADAVAQDPTTTAALAAARDTGEEIKILLERLRLKTETDGQLVAQGGLSDWLAGVRDRLVEATSRAAGFPGYTASVLVAEFRKPMNELVSVFLGDVFAYINTRFKDGKLGEIPQLMLEKLERAQANKLEREGEPLVVLTHSMGGQIVYDALTYFLPSNSAYRDLRIDFWCATASQVGFFEETKLFLGSTEEYKTGNNVPFPKHHLGIWWNVWDHNDFVSFTAKDIIDGVMDEEYDSGMSLIAAHGGYLDRPSFYRAFAKKLRQAADRHWGAL